MPVKQVRLSGSAEGALASVTIPAAAMLADTGWLLQWVYFDAAEALPATAPPPTSSTPDSRHSAQVAVFGEEVQAALSSLKLFMVGSGALGCELLKNFAMMGVACSDGGSLTLTDDDVIEVSNLSRQFLFRNSDVGENKSVAAGRAVSAMNSQIDGQLTAMQNRVSSKTEDVFDSGFWESLDVVVNALDNVPARYLSPLTRLLFC